MRFSLIVDYYVGYIGGNEFKEAGATGEFDSTDD